MRSTEKKYYKIKEVSEMLDTHLNIAFLGTAVYGIVSSTVERQ